ncbi:MAG: hypothetical protein GXN91_03665, partial [Epsilonproteobacteria bacterium]|nr:hypothetical protein [Campylobacterota bacterium]
MKKVISIIALFILVGCASNNEFVKRHQSMIGKDINLYIAKNGYPDSSYTLPNGNRVFVYERKDTITYPNFVFPAFT